MPGPVVLVVDPAPQTAERAAQALAGSSFSVRVARDAAEAEAVLAHGDVAAVLASMSFPRGNGYDLARQVRSRVPEAAIYLVCGGFDVYSAERAAEAGVTGRIARPFTVEVLRKHLEAVLGPLSDSAREREASAESARIQRAEAAESLPEMEASGIEALDSISGPFVRPLASLSSAEGGADPAPPVGDERISSFLPRDWRSLPTVRVDPQVVAPAMERAILAVLPEVVEAVINKAIATSPAFREMLEVAVEEIVRQELPTIARRVVRERLAEIENGPKGSGEG